MNPTAPGTGPFADPDFLEVVHRHFPLGDVRTAERDGGMAAVELVDGVVVGVGHRDLVDYRSPLGPDGPNLVAELVGADPVSLDSLPAEAAEPIASALRGQGRTVSVVEDDLTAELSLPATFDDWLARIGKKERHETRRKRRRYEEIVGPVEVAVFDTPGSRLDEFVELHRGSVGEKQDFMTDEMAAYFGDLLALEGWSISALLDPDGAMVAAGFGAHDMDGFSLYNSAYDRRRASASPGVVLVSSLVEHCVVSGARRLDFLKGDEAYKFRLGARRRPLYTVSA